ncbi:hypothetical protein SteCoe_37712 [Stentor coeruleus]|uniref:Uncharacterized protein n=1 Tax=Stentor coeruleus TaxID=5963 RepID=A0A1R2AMH0_9CILI|nr:hypothetical protein SteCoe_37712 [Stentor coeruleus]
MNPWDYGRLGPANLQDYLDMLRLKKVQVHEDLITIQREIFQEMDRYSSLAGHVKEEQDLEKVGEFVDVEKIKEKSELLGSIGDYLEKINKSKQLFVKKANESSPGNQLYVELENQPSFFKVSGVVKDVSLLQMANQANKLHEGTKNTLVNSLSTSQSEKSAKILSEIQILTQQTSSVLQKYLKPIS